MQYTHAATYARVLTVFRRLQWRCQREVSIVHATVSSKPFTRGTFIHIMQVYNMYTQLYIVLWKFSWEWGGGERTFTLSTTSCMFLCVLFGGWLVLSYIRSYLLSQHHHVIRHEACNLYGLCFVLKIMLYYTHTHSHTQKIHGRYGTRVLLPVV